MAQEESKGRDDSLRAYVKKLLAWEDAHVGFDAAVAGIAPERRGSEPTGIPFSPWQLLEHLRLTQHDILDFCRNAGYVERKWPEDYWPPSPVPPTSSAWEESIAAFRRDRDALEKLAADSSVDLFARIPHGSGQTYLRELLLAADHSAYHVGQMVLVRRGLGIWPAK
ncbi:MAG TPA: DinB family protein [Candidatus Limnocylindrales bacterium]|nr:DinB family protein [Candidatus Limnocylindrales bacterium]